MDQKPGFRRIIGGLPQCSGHCQQGRAVCDCDPSLPIGQDEPDSTNRLRMVAEWASKHTGWITLWVMVGSVSAALLLAHWGAR